jgi:hypothetical protein
MSIFTSLETYLIAHLAAADPTSWTGLVNEVIGHVIGPQARDIVQKNVTAVKAAPPAGATGEQKKAAATTGILAELEAVGLQLEPILLNLAIEAAVAYMNAKTGSKPLAVKKIK